MTENKRFILDDDEEYLINTETGDMWDATGGGSGVPYLINLVNKLLEENEQLKAINSKQKALLDELKR